MPNLVLSSQLSLFHFQHFKDIWLWTQDLNHLSEEHKPQVLCLNETKLDSTVRDNDLTIKGFHPIFRKDRDRHVGGVAIYIRNEIKFLQREDMKTDFESLTVEIIRYVKPILVTTIYRPPDSVVEMFDKIDGLLYKLESENKESIIAGDMNCNLMKEGDNDTKHIKHIYNSFSYTQLTENATQTTVDTMTLIDHLATTRPMTISDKGVIPCGISDHDATFLVRSMRIPRIKTHSKIRKARKFKNFGNYLFLKDLEALNLDEIKNITKDPNQMWSLWKNLFLGVLDKHAPIIEIKIRDNNLPYVASEMRQLIRTRDHLKKKANQTISKYIFQPYQQVRRKVSYGIRKLRSDYYTKKIKESIGDLKATWKILNEVINKDQTTAEINERTQNDLNTAIVKDNELFTIQYITTADVIRSNHIKNQSSLYALTKLKFSKHHSYFKYLLILSGDINLHPGPVKYPCSVCAKPVRKRTISCEKCGLWLHKKM